MRPHVKPTPRPCSACGELVVHEFGVFDADLYEAGRLFRHECPMPEIPPMYEPRQIPHTPAQKTPPAPSTKPTQGFRPGKQARGGVE